MRPNHISACLWLWRGRRAAEALGNLAGGEKPAFVASQKLATVNTFFLSCRHKSCIRRVPGERRGPVPLQARQPGARSGQQRGGSRGSGRGLTPKHPTQVGSVAPPPSPSPSACWGLAGAQRWGGGSGVQHRGGDEPVLPMARHVPAPARGRGSSLEALKEYSTGNYRTGKM